MPCARAQRCTGSEKLSIEREMPPSAGSTASSRAISMSGGTPRESGLEDAAPMSSTSAPCATSARPCAIAAAGSRYFPPSKKESSVTFRMPKICGRATSRTSAGMLRIRQGPGLDRAQIGRRVDLAAVVALRAVAGDKDKAHQYGIADTRAMDLGQFVIGDLVQLVRKGDGAAAVLDLLVRNAVLQTMGDIADAGACTLADMNRKRRCRLGTRDERQAARERPEPPDQTASVPAKARAPARCRRAVGRRRGPTVPGRGRAPALRTACAPA